MNLPSKLFPLYTSENVGQQAVPFHDYEDSFGILVATVFIHPDLHPAMAVCILGLLTLLFALIYDVVSKPITVKEAKKEYHRCY